MATCKKCGNEIDDKAYMCVYCGTLTGSGERALTLNKVPVKAEPSTAAQKLGIVGIVFALFFQLVTWICSGIGLSVATRNKKKAQEAWQKQLQQLTEAQASQEQIDYSRYEADCEIWQSERARQLNIWALIISVALSVVAFFAILASI